ncbi:MAG: methyltransferase domain-containing protein [Asgard group archaeon]|nr:methyltransferase domain-containing protein [Asgard group archaeon]
MDKKEMVRKGYNIAAEGYLDKRNESLEEMNFMPEFCSLIPKESLVLDLGCGAGIPFTSYLSERFDVIGIDISDKQIELAKKNVPKATFIRKDMTELDFDDNYFGGILAYFSIIHIPREEHQSLFVNLYRILQPNGVALFTLHSTDDPEYINEDFFGSKMYWSGFDTETNLKLLKEAGFKIIWFKLITDTLNKDVKALYVFIKK